MSLPRIIGILQSNNALAHELAARMALLNQSKVIAL
jgi:hypothetical protein